MSFSDTYNPSAPAAAGDVQGSAISNREDLTDVLTILAPEETPVLSSASRERASSTFVEWTVDKLDNPSTAGIAEGADINTFTDQFRSRARLGNYVQKFRRDYMVSDLQEAVDSVGPAKVAQAEAKAIRELKRDIEATLVSAENSSAENGAGTPYRLRGLGKWLDGNNADVPADYETPAESRVTAAGSSLSETSLNTVIRSIYKEIGTTQNLTLIADPNLRVAISDFARFGELGTAGQGDASIRNVNYNGESTTIKLSVDIYQSDFGTVTIVNSNPACSRDLTNLDVGYLVNSDYYGIHELIPMGSTRLPNQGGGERGFVDCALTLGVYHPKAHGMIN